MTGTKFEGAVVDGDEVVATLHDGKRKSETRVEMVLVAIGRAPVTGSLNLDAAGVKTNERGQVPVNGFMQTNIPTVYAIGDIVPTPQLALLPAQKRRCSRLTTLQVKAPRLSITSSIQTVRTVNQRSQASVIPSGLQKKLATKSRSRKISILSTWKSSDHEPNGWFRESHLRYQKLR